jgi:hypothetical protein
MRLPQEQLVLLLLANAADPEGVAFAWWKHKAHWWTYLVERSRLSRASVFRHLATIEELGLGKRRKLETVDGDVRFIMELDLTKSVDLPPQDSPQSQSHGETESHGETDSVSSVRLQEESIQESNISGGGDARAREPLISPEAISLAEEIATIAGHPDPKAWPPGWCGAAMRVEAFLREGYHPDHMRAAAREVMSSNPKSQPWSIGYFEKAFARSKSRADAPLPIADTGGQNGRAEAIRNGFVGRVGARTNRSNRSPKEQRWAAAWDNVDALLGLSGSDADRDGAEVGEAPAGRLPESGGT